MESLYADVKLSETQIYQTMTALDYYMHNLDDDFRTELIEIRRKLNTALSEHVFN